MKKKKVMVGLSGGVDSSVAAAILMESGYEVIGVTMQIWPDNADMESASENGCCSITAVDDARRIANKLGIAYYVMNFKSLFQDKVIEYFKEEYLNGRTPNPCIACNKYIKFEDLLNKANAMGIEFISTGHYAKVEQGEDGLFYLKKSDDNMKDQTYALYNLTQAQLSKVLMPLGFYEKTRVREIARSLGFSVANKKDSQEICFIEDNDYARFIRENTNKKIEIGDFIDLKGNVLGKHKGLIYYTIGQRKGLGITFGKPMYVVKIDIENNRVVLGEDKDLFTNELMADNLNIISGKPFEDIQQVEVKIRYSSKLAKAKLYPIDEKKVKVVFDELQRAVTPGQAAVFYKNDIVLGGGTIV